MQRNYQTGEKNSRKWYHAIGTMQRRKREGERERKVKVWLRIIITQTVLKMGGGELGIKILG